MLKITIVLILSLISGFASIGKISLINGKVEISRDNNTIKAKNGLVILKKDIIKTFKNSKAQIRFKDSTVITIGAESSFKVEEYFFDTKKPKATFKFLRGTFKSITGKIGKIAPQNFKLRTKTATIGIRGTTVLGKITSNGDIIACLQGAIVVSSIDTANSISLVAGNYTKVQKGKPPLPPQKISSEIINNFSQNNIKDKKQTNTFPVNIKENYDMNSDNIIEKIVTDSLDINKITDISSKIPSGKICSSSFSYPTSWSTNLLLPSVDTTQIMDGSVIFCSKISTNNTENFVPNTGILSLNIDGTTDSLDNSYISYYESSMIIGPAYISNTVIYLTKESDPSTMTYQDINNFSIKDFDSINGWIQTNNSYPDDYVSWGYWEMEENFDNLTQNGNFWVAGVDKEAADDFISSKITDSTNSSYQYNGHVLGIVKDDTTQNFSNIDPTTNNEVLLKFDFGGGSGSLANGSYIKFQTEGVNPEVWQMNLSGTINGGSFTVENSNQININGTDYDGSTNNNPSFSTVSGSFYGDEAQSVGGTFTGETMTKTATGVFKASRNQ